MTITWCMVCIFGHFGQKKWENKTRGDIIILEKCNKNHDHMLYYSWDIARDKCISYFSVRIIFCPPPSHLAGKKSKFQKFQIRCYHFRHVYQKLWLMIYRLCTVPDKWCAKDGWTDGQKIKKHRGGCPTFKIKKQLLVNGNFRRQFKAMFQGGTRKDNLIERSKDVVL